jgi:DNA ligase-associated metallophosphoesterase
MNAPVKHIIQNNTFWLSAQRCVFWEEEKALILSDLHLGKTGHFRKHGIAVPQAVFTEDMQRLIEQIAYFNPTRIIAVGDLFHSKANKEHDLFLKWRNDFPSIEFILVRGNHDILEKEWYETAAIKVHEGCYAVNQFGFMHDPEDCLPEEHAMTFVFSGHLHPGIHVTGIGKQSLSFPCFYFTAETAILPAFSKFSGLAMIRPKKKDHVFAIIDQKVVAL